MSRNAREEEERNVGVVQRWWDSVLRCCAEGDPEGEEVHWLVYLISQTIHSLH